MASFPRVKNHNDSKPPGEREPVLVALASNSRSRILRPGRTLRSYNAPMDHEGLDGWPDEGFLDRLREIAEEIEANKAL